MIEHGNIGQDLRKKNKDFTMDSTIRTIQDHGDLTVGYRRYIFWVFIDSGNQIVERKNQHQTVKFHYMKRSWIENLKRLDCTK